MLDKDTQLTDQQRIKQLEKELFSLKESLMSEIKYIQSTIGITPGYVHEPVKPYKNSLCQK